MPDPVCKRCSGQAIRVGGPCRNCMCGAKVKNTRGLPDKPEHCTQWPIEGAKRCRFHGGGAPHVRKAAKRNVAERKARRELDQVGEFAPVENPLTELALVAGRARTFMEILQGHVERLEGLAQDNLTGPDA